uniref:Uncharacterized protein n=1 Tax=Candidatus Kentrum sp. FM TaxID=2126340 RepID=A0A450SJC4_9GAMM|nr:MAG: hypothetical protein BECKFM1743A_GA0114220_1011511 [Candidatus Kentron sp. FM]
MWLARRASVKIGEYSELHDAILAFAQRRQPRFRDRRSRPGIFSQPLSMRSRSCIVYDGIALVANQGQR